MPYTESFKKLVVWQKAVLFAQEVYKETRALPKEELFSMTNQLRRAAVSVASNIAEGARRGTDKDFLQFLRIASGSGAEAETQMVIAMNVYPTASFVKSFALLEEVQRMLNGLIRKIK